MKKKLALLGLTSLLALSTVTTAFAGQWKLDHVGWWWQEDDGSYPVNSWKEINGKWYYFDSIGYMLENTTTPDGYKVGADGAWIIEESKEFKLDSRVEQILFSPTYEEATAGLTNIEKRWTGGGAAGGFWGVGGEIIADNLDLESLTWVYGGYSDGYSAPFDLYDPLIFDSLEGTINQVFDGLEKEKYTVDEFEILIKSLGGVTTLKRDEIVSGYYNGLTDAQSYYYTRHECLLRFTLDQYTFLIKGDYNNTVFDINKASVRVWSPRNY